MVKPERLKAVALQAVSAFRRGVSGDDFAHGLVSLHEDGAQIYGLLALFGAERIITVLRESADWPQLAPREAEVRNWIEEFLSYGQPDQEAEPND